jgi:hypothetical protein
VIPAVAAPGMNVTLFSPLFVSGQTWLVTFTSGNLSQEVSATVVNKRDITDPTGNLIDAQLVVTVPPLTPGPTSIAVQDLPTNPPVLTIPSSGFVAMGSPPAVSEPRTNVELNGYATGVGSDGTLYIGVSGLNSVCNSMSFIAQLFKYPAHFSNGDVLIVNWQGYLIDALTPQSQNHFLVSPSGDPNSSDSLTYFRHSFQQYCQDHLPGHPLEVDPTDPNWHLDGTPHVDYSTVIFEIHGHLDGGAGLTPGVATSHLHLKAGIGSGTGDWEREHSEEGSNASH